ncbi:MAG: hypothetical protein EZS28_002586 [Streblomastix strix]|uniref:Uncharacterized protein n=1 Tax=Streblomastix strix TaxID=222440 RepID=A0A5J4X5T3_9EUKA|nr:MAG: hypothetical protein EZS28_002586 [Streblomastix strix]
MDFTSKTNLNTFHLKLHVQHLVIEEAAREYNRTKSAEMYLDQVLLRDQNGSSSEFAMEKIVGSLYWNYLLKEIQTSLDVGRVIDVWRKDEHINFKSELIDSKKTINNIWAYDESSYFTQYPIYYSSFAFNCSLDLGQSYKVTIIQFTRFNISFKQNEQLYYENAPRFEQLLLQLEKVAGIIFAADKNRQTNAIKAPQLINTSLVKKIPSTETTLKVGFAFDTIKFT